MHLIRGRVQNAKNFSVSIFMSGPGAKIRWSESSANCKTPVLHFEQLPVLKEQEFIEGHFLIVTYSGVTAIYPS